MTDDEREVAQLLAGGLGEAEVRALFPSVDPARREVAEVADWLRQSAAGSGRSTSDYLGVRIMSLVDDDADKCDKCGRGGRLDPTAKASLLTALARMRSKGR